MKVYFTLTDGIKNDEANLNMLKLSLKTAKENTSLQLNALYDGSEDDNVYQIFKEYGVNVILCKCSFEDKLENYYKSWEFDGSLLNSLKRMIGCFMKFDIALYEQEDDVVLYSDIDTIFVQDTDWDKFKDVKTIAVAPEFNKDDFDIIKGYKYFSAGIMLLNIPELKKRREKLFYMLDNRIEPYQECWDQGFFNELYKHDFEVMPFELNWKPYWGINDNAVIIHIHGWKIEHALSQKNVEFCKFLMKINKNAIEGIIYYTLQSYRLLGINKDKYIIKLIQYLYDVKMLLEKPPKKQYNISTYVLYNLYKKTNNFQSKFSKLNSYVKNKLIKRKIIKEDRILEEKYKY